MPRVILPTANYDPFYNEDNTGENVHTPYHGLLVIRYI